LAAERIEKNIRQFWLTTCGIDTHERSPQHARHDTPWNAFSEDNVLVCTLWNDMIVKVFDPLEQRFRQFVRLGGKMRHWKGPAVRHGEDANSNLKKAAREKLRVVGFEAEPDKAALQRGERKVAYFYLNRAHELQRIFELSGHDMIDRLQLEQKFNATRSGQAVEAIEPGNLFELVASHGEIPRSRGAFADRDADTSSKTNPSNDSPFNERSEQNVDSEASSAKDAEDDGELFDSVTDEKLSTEDYARKCLPILVEHVLKQRDDVLQTLTYLELAERLDRRNKNEDFWARGLGHVLSRVTSMLDELQTDWIEPVPYLTTIVVSGTGTDKGLPAAGIKEKWHQYESLTRSEKQSRVMREYDRILNYGSRWNDILVQLGLTPIIPPPADEVSPREGSGGWGGGESLHHKALKRHVKENPAIVGADGTWFATEEYALRSGDSVDVFFKRENAWIAVEVKSAISDALIADYERGLYQVVKYKAVLEAQAKIDCPGALPTIKVLLLLENRLPRQLLTTAARLGVDVVENIKPFSSSSKLDHEQELVDAQVE
jgi:hypothetical protein